MNPRRSSRKSPSHASIEEPARKQQNNNDAKFPIVGIGASAGGLEAFSELLKNLPRDTGMAFVLIQHLNPDYQSLLSEILGRITLLPVSEVTEGVAVEPNRVYIIPPNTQMIVSQGNLRLTPREKIKGKYMPIDFFFRSLALEWESKAIAVVLSGLDGDGALGLEAVKAAGGITFAQDSATAKFDGMPHSAVATGSVDFILPPASIARELAKISQHPYVNRSTSTPTEERAESEDSLLQIFAMLLSATGVDFTYYKHATLRRRIKRQMVIHNRENLSDYVTYLQENPAEIEVLYQDMLIHVTSFFRDPGTFEALKTQVFPIISQGKSRETPIRIWIPGCSTGEEAYSIAICLLEFLEDRREKPAIQIFATDISETVIEKARASIYKQNLLGGVSPERLRRFFVQVEGGYQISKPVRELCVFARQNLNGDPPFSRLDLISCRNVLIYLGSSLQKKVMPIFHYALNSTGFLMLGTSESTGEFSDLFALVDKKHRIYSRKIAPVRLRFDLIIREHPLEKTQLGKRVNEDRSNDLDLQKEADRIVLNKYAPVGAVVNNDLEILQFRGQTSPYLSPAPGKASFNLLKMAREGLLIDLRTAIHQAKKLDAPVRKEGLQVKYDEQYRTVNIEVIPFRPNLQGQPFFLVLFEDASRLPRSSAQSSDERETVKHTEAEKEISQLRQELAAAKEYLQSIIEEQEATNQDLKVANEEILSSNEELQSTNEELETAKEEIQATNEELSTINEELRSRNLELNQVNNDLRNLLSSINIPILMLGGDLRIRRFTPLAERLFNLIPSDVGRPFSNIHPNIDVPNLLPLILEVIDTLSIQELEVQDREGHWYSLRIRPYKTVENQIDGAVISLIDIDQLKHSAIALQDSRDYAAAIVETVREPLVVLNSELRVITANRSFYQTFGVSSDEVEQQLIFDVQNGQWNILQLRSLLEDMIPRDTKLENFEVSQVFDQIGTRTMLLNASKIPCLGDMQMILLAIEDITQRRQAEEQITNSLHEKEILLREVHHRVKNNLQIISSLLSLQSNRVVDLQAGESLQDSQNRISAMALVHEILYQSANFSQLNFAEYIENLVTHLFRSYSIQFPKISQRLDIQRDIMINPDKAVLCGLIVNELVTNALKHGFKNEQSGEVFIVLQQESEHQLTLKVGNDGDDLPPEIDLQNLQSMGLNLVMNLVQQLKGTLELERNGQTVFTIKFDTSL